MIKKLAVMIIISFVTAILTGCNTMHGLGKDIEHLGQAMKQSASRE